MKVIFTIICILIFGFTLSTVKNAIGIWSYPKEAYDCRADILLVMGAAQYNGVPSPAFKRRLDKALELYEQNCASKILVTGGKREGDLFTEGESGVTYLSLSGVPKENLQPEIYSGSSYENLNFSKTFLIDKKVLIVTDDMHAYRTQWLANKIGIDARVVPVITKYQRWRYALRELTIMAFYSLKEVGSPLRISL